MKPDALENVMLEIDYYTIKAWGTDWILNRDAD